MRRGSWEALCSQLDAVPGDGAGARGTGVPQGCRDGVWLPGGGRQRGTRHVALCHRRGQEDSGCFQQVLRLKLLQVWFAGFLVLTFYLVQRDSLEI